MDNAEKNMNVFPFPEKTACFEILRQDILFEKIPVTDYERLISIAWERGESAALNLFKDKENILSFLEKEEIQIVRSEGYELVGRYRYFAEICPKIKTIRLYVDSVALWAGHNHIEYKDAEKIILAHEYFHYMEYTGAVLAARKLYTVKTLSILGLTLCRSGLWAVSEIGAYAFSNVYYNIFPKRAKGGWNG